MLRYSPLQPQGGRKAGEPQLVRPIGALGQPDGPMEEQKNRHQSTVAQPDEDDYDLDDEDYGDEGEGWYDSVESPSTSPRGPAKGAKSPPAKAAVKTPTKGKAKFG